MKEREKFQFHSGSIKSNVLLGLHRSQFGFNSIVVRLKGFGRPKPKRICTSFNSIVVRLKASHAGHDPVEQDAFQFHSGSIKRF